MVPVCKFFFIVQLQSLLFIGAGAGEKNTRSRSKTDRLRNTGCNQSELHCLLDAWWWYLIIGHGLGHGVYARVGSCHRHHGWHQAGHHRCWIQKNKALVFLLTQLNLCGSQHNYQEKKSSLFLPRFKIEGKNLRKSLLSNSMNPKTFALVPIPILHSVH